MIIPAIEKTAPDFLRGYCAEFKGVYFHGVGSTETHIHLLAQIEPNICPSDFVGKIKGASSHELNKLLGKNTIPWQRGYGVVSFAKLNLPGVQSYVRNQKAHHAAGRVKKPLEECALDDHYEEENG